MGLKNSLGMLISGQYEITKDQMLRIDGVTYPERTLNIELCVVTDDSNSDKGSEKFLEELQELLSRYAI